MSLKFDFQAMELFSLRGVTGLPDSVPIQQKYKLFLYGNLFDFALKGTQLIIEWGSYLARQ